MARDAKEGAPKRNRGRTRMKGGGRNEKGAVEDPKTLGSMRTQEESLRSERTAGDRSEKGSDGRLNPPSVEFICVNLFGTYKLV